MGKIIRSLAAFIAVLVLTALLEPMVMGKFAEWGWHDRPEQIAGDFVNWVIRLFGEVAFPWIAAGGLGLGVGVWAHYFATIKDRAKPNEAKLFQELGDRIYMMASKLQDMSEYWDAYECPPEQQGRWPSDAAGMYIALENDLRRIRVSIPPFGDACSNEN